MARALSWMTRVLACAVIVVGLLVLSAGLVAAHGETAQEPFLRGDTISFFDVNFSTDRIDQGQPLTITGKFKILETWPRELAEPETAYLSVTAPGPVFVVSERRIGGELTPMSFYVEKGKVYDFSITVLGRSPGTYHVHPTVYIEGSGPLLGPGKWITVSPVPGGFKMPVKLLDGTVIPDLQTYRQWFIVAFTIGTFVLGMAWMLYWTVPKPTVTRLAVTNVIPSAYWGSDFGLITRRDVRNVAIIALLAVAMLVGGWVYMQTSHPNIIPLQVHRRDATALQLPALPVSTKPVEATYDRQTKKLAITVQFTNSGSEPVTIERMMIANREFLAVPPQHPEWQSQFSTSGDRTLQPGETRQLTFTVQGDFLETERLVPVKQTPFMAITTTVELRSQTQAASYITVQSPLRFAS